MLAYWRFSFILLSYNVHSVVAFDRPSGPFEFDQSLTKNIIVLCRRITVDGFFKGDLPPFYVPLLMRGLDSCKEGDVIPDETTILNFRHYLEKYHLTEKIFEMTKGYLADKGLLLREGTIVDATIINASPSTKNESRTRDPEMKQTKKGNQWYFGMKAHVGTDTGRGLAHSIVVTSAAVHDSQVMDDLLHGEENAVYGDKAYSNTVKSVEFEAQGIEWHIDRKSSPNHPLTQEDKEWNHAQHKTRAKGEHIFGVVKHLWGYRKVRYKGVAKDTAQVFSLFALANLHLVRKDLLLLRG